MEQLIDIVFLCFLVITGFALLRLRNLFAVVMLTGLYSLLSAALFVILDAVDVAFTEAAVGAGVASILMLSTLARTGREQHLSNDDSLLALVVVLVTGIALLYGTLDMPSYGDANAPAHQHVAPRYLEESGEAIGIPNVVTSVLASYRGYDTLGEVTVIFTAGVGVMALLMSGMGRGGRGSRRQGGAKTHRPDP
ncbi:MAG: DUF4040 domain-containing protein [Gammaproteobacteria bacterium]|nr:DUF4040 domain-containing protein [Gammaproteobacteria bacterium]NNJ83880.1 DUF4040 domain-containing protein [Gammaproteobacteria bacterium]